LGALPFASTSLGPVLYVSWRGVSAEDLREVRDQVADLRRACGGPVVYLSRIPADNHVFSEEERTMLVEFLLAILPSCASIHHVVEGSGFVKSARRSIVTNMALATPRSRDFFTYDTMLAAKAAIELTYGVDLRDLAMRRSRTTASSSFRAAGQIAQKVPSKK
jgi:hypothetical protein